METICQKLEVRPLFTVNNLCGKSGTYFLDKDAVIIIYYLDNETKVLTLTFCKINKEGHSLDAVSKSVFTFPEMIGDVVDIHFIRSTGGRVGLIVTDALKKSWLAILIPRFIR